MEHLRRKLLYEFYKLLDLAILVCVLAFVMFYFSEIPKELTSSDVLAFFSFKMKFINVILLAMLVVIWPTILSTFGLYQSQRSVKLGQDFITIWKAVGVGTMLMAAMVFIFGRKNITISTLVSFWIICSLMIFFSRLVLRKFLFEARKHGRNLRHVIIIGNGKRGHDLASILMKKKELGYKLVGFVDDKVNGKNSTDELSCSLDELPEFLGNHVIDEVFLTLPIKTYYNRISEVIKVCEQQGIPVHIQMDFFNGGISKITPVMVEGRPFLVHYTGRELDLRKMFFKRTVDVLLSTFFIVLFLPLLLIITLLIKFISKGPLFFVQERVGYNKRTFKLIKFRTMVEDAEALQPEFEHFNEVNGPIFKIKNDPRITKIGKFLRRTSMDELPQLFNVLKGDMSLVGPRPLPLRDVRLFAAQWPKRRFSVRPGITGLWQVNGRNKAEFDKLVKYDLEYIDNWSSWMDMKIMFKTVPIVITGHGAM